MRSQEFEEKVFSGLGFVALINNENKRIEREKKYGTWSKTSTCSIILPELIAGYKKMKKRKFAISWSDDDDDLLARSFEKIRNSISAALWCSDDPMSPGMNLGLGSCAAMSCTPTDVGKDL